MPDPCSGVVRGMVLEGRPYTSGRALEPARRPARPLLKLQSGGLGAAHRTHDKQIRLRIIGACVATVDPDQSLAVAFWAGVFVNGVCPTERAHT